MTSKTRAAAPIAAARRVVKPLQAKTAMIRVEAAGLPHAHATTIRLRLGYITPVRFPTPMIIAALAAASVFLPAAASAAPATPPQPIQLSAGGGWQVRDDAAAPAKPQPPPPDESEEGSEGATPNRVRTEQVTEDGAYRGTRVPSVFDPTVVPDLFGGQVKVYRLRFRAPKTKRFKWLLRFEQARRRTTVFLNRRRLGVSVDPYTPFQMEAKGLRPGEMNVLHVYVDNRKDPRLPEGWWNWGGITRPVWLVPKGRMTLSDLGLLSNVVCKGPASGCKAGLIVDGLMSRLPEEGPRFVRKGRKRYRLAATQPKLTVRLRSPVGRVTRKTFTLKGSRKGRRRQLLELPVPAPKLWSPERPQLYSASATLSYKGRVEQVERKRIGLRSVKVKGTQLYLNNRPIQLRGASIHDDFPGVGAAVSGHEMDTTVRELKELGANVTRSHYVLSEAMLSRLDRAGILVWNQAPVWQRDHGANLLRIPSERRRAHAQVLRTVKAARNHPSVITHSVANELTFTPDRKPWTRRFLIDAAEATRDLDPTLPVALDIKGRPGFEEQFTYQRFDILGINQYFGWYPWVEDFNTLEPYLREMHDLYPDTALVMTEFGAEGRPDMASSEPETKGSYGFQEMHVARTLDLVDRLPFMNGAIHWTLREFEIYPGWRGGAVSGPGANTRHHKGLLTYDGGKKPAWSVARDHFLRVPLYR